MKITHYKQEHSHTCGIAAMRMLLSNRKITITEQEYLKLVTVHSYGIFSTELALPFVKKGMKAVAYTFNLPIFGHLHLEIGTQIKVENLQLGLGKPSTKIVSESIRDFLLAGGVMVWQHPSTNHLKNSLARGPLLVSVNTAALGDYWRHWNNGHYLVISEIGDAKTHVFDPYYPEVKGDYWVENDRLVSAITINSTHSTDYCLTLE